MDLLPIIVPLGINEEDLLRILDNAQGLLITGGEDIVPARYGAVPLVINNIVENQFCIGVQSHPEILVEEGNLAWLKLFAAFGDAAGKFNKDLINNRK